MDWFRQVPPIPGGGGYPPHFPSQQQTREPSQPGYPQQLNSNNNPQGGQQQQHNPRPLPHQQRVPTLPPLLSHPQQLFPLRDTSSSPIPIPSSSPTASSSQPRMPSPQTYPPIIPKVTPSADHLHVQARERPGQQPQPQPQQTQQPHRHKSSRHGSKRSSRRKPQQPPSAQPSISLQSTSTSNPLSTSPQAGVAPVWRFEQEVVGRFQPTSDVGRGSSNSSRTLPMARAPSPPMHKHILSLSQHQSAPLSSSVVPSSMEPPQFPSSLLGKVDPIRDLGYPSLSSSQSSSSSPLVPPPRPQSYLFEKDNLTLKPTPNPIMPNPSPPQLRREPSALSHEPLSATQLGSLSSSEQLLRHAPSEFSPLTSRPSNNLQGLPVLPANHRPPLKLNSNSNNPSDDRLPPFPLLKTNPEPTSASRPGTTSPTEAVMYPADVERYRGKVTSDVQLTTQLAPMGGIPRNPDTSRPFSSSWPRRPDGNLNLNVPKPFAVAQTEVPLRSATATAQQLQQLQQQEGSSYMGSTYIPNPARATFQSVPVFDERERNSESNTSSSGSSQRTQGADGAFSYAGAAGSAGPHGVGVEHLRMLPRVVGGSSTTPNFGHPTNHHQLQQQQASHRLGASPQPQPPHQHQHQHQFVVQHQQEEDLSPEAVLRERWQRQRREQLKNLEMKRAMRKAEAEAAGKTPSSRKTSPRRSGTGGSSSSVANGNRNGNENGNGSESTSKRKGRRRGTSSSNSHAAAELELKHQLSSAGAVVDKPEARNAPVEHAAVMAVAKELERELGLSESPRLTNGDHSKSKMSSVLGRHPASLTKGIPRSLTEARPSSGSGIEMLLNQADDLEITANNGADSVTQFVIQSKGTNGETKHSSGHRHQHHHHHQKLQAYSQQQQLPQQQRPHHPHQHGTGHPRQMKPQNLNVNVTVNVTTPFGPELSALADSFEHENLASPRLAQLSPDTSTSFAVAPSVDPTPSSSPPSGPMYHLNPLMIHPNQTTSSSPDDDSAKISEQAFLSDTGKSSSPTTPFPILEERSQALPMVGVERDAKARDQVKVNVAIEVQRKREEVPVVRVSGDFKRANDPYVPSSSSRLPVELPVPDLAPPASATVKEISGIAEPTREATAPIQRNLEERPAEYSKDRVVAPSPAASTTKEDNEKASTDASANHHEAEADSVEAPQTPATTPTDADDVDEHPNENDESGVAEVASSEALESKGKRKRQQPERLASFGAASSRPVRSGRAKVETYNEAELARKFQPGPKKRKSGGQGGGGAGGGGGGAASSSGGASRSKSKARAGAVEVRRAGFIADNVYELLGKTSYPRPDRLGFADGEVNGELVDPEVLERPFNPFGVIMENPEWRGDRRPDAKGDEDSHISTFEDEEHHPDDEMHHADESNRIEEDKQSTMNAESSESATQEQSVNVQMPREPVVAISYSIPPADEDAVAEVVPSSQSSSSSSAEAASTINQSTPSTMEEEAKLGGSSSSSIQERKLPQEEHEDKRGADRRRPPRRASAAAHKWLQASQIAGAAPSFAGKGDKQRVEVLEPAMAIARPLLGALDLAAEWETTSRRFPPPTPMLMSSSMDKKGKCEARDRRKDELMEMLKRELFESKMKLKAMELIHRSRCSFGKDRECAMCGVLDCKYSDSMHYHMGGCPSCTEHQEDDLLAAAAKGKGAAAAAAATGSVTDPSSAMVVVDPLAKFTLVEKAQMSDEEFLQLLNYPTELPIHTLRLETCKSIIDKNLKKDNKDPGYGFLKGTTDFSEHTFINCDLRYYNLHSVGKYDVVLIDPPWRIRGNNLISSEKTMFNNSKFQLSYNTLSNEEIIDIDVGALSDKGFIFLWVINSQLEFGFECLRKWGYTYVDRITWVKKTNTNNIAISQGYYFLHSSEICLIGVKCKGDSKSLEFISKVSNDLLFAPIRQKSRKPDQIYHIIERMLPGGRKVELFARNHNLRPGWLSLGNQLGEYYDWDHDLIACDKCGNTIHTGRTRYKARWQANKDLCGECFKQSGDEKTEYFEIENVLNEMAFHQYFACDGCGTKPIWGLRFHCAECDDCDLCELCYDNKQVPPHLEGKHQVKHHFDVVEIPDLAGGLPVHHSHRCGGCQSKPIIGYRFMCYDCNISLCQKCFFLKKEPKTHRHTHHTELLTEDFANDPTKCITCASPIEGVRYRCKSCYNYDVCESCHESKKPPPATNTSHKPSHKFRKIG